MMPSRAASIRPCDHADGAKRRCVHGTYVFHVAAHDPGMSMRSTTEPNARARFAPPANFSAAGPLERYPAIATPPFRVVGGSQQVGALVSSSVPRFFGGQGTFGRNFGFNPLLNQTFSNPFGPRFSFGTGVTSSLNSPFFSQSLNPLLNTGGATHFPSARTALCS